MDVVQLTRALWHWTLSRFSVYLTAHLFSLHFLACFRMLLTKITNALLPFTKPSHLTLEVHQVGQAWFPLHKSVLTVPNYFLVHNLFQKIPSSSQGWRWGWLISSFSKIERTFAFFHFWGASSGHHDLSKTVEDDLKCAMIQLPQHSWLYLDIDPSPSWVDFSCFRQNSPLVLVTWDTWKQILPIKTKVKKALSTSLFRISFPKPILAYSTSIYISPKAWEGWCCPCLGPACAA